MSVSISLEKEVKALCELTENLMKAPSEAALQALDKKVAAMVADQNFAAFSKGLDLIQGRIKGIKEGLGKSDVRLDCIGIRNKVFGIFKKFINTEDPFSVVRKVERNNNKIWETFAWIRKENLQQALKEIEEYIIVEQVDLTHGMCREGWLFSRFCQSNRFLEIIKLLLRAGVDVNPDGNSPDYAICNAYDNSNSDERKVDLLRLLIDEGLDVNRTFGYAHYCVATFPLQFLQMLIDAGANVNGVEQDERGMKIVDLTWMNAYQDGSPVYEQIAQRTQLLIFNGATIDLANFEKRVTQEVENRRYHRGQDHPEVAACIMKNAMRRRLIFESLSIRDNVLKEMSYDLVQELAETPALQKQAMDVLRIMASYVGFTAEEASKDPAFRKQMLTRCQAKKDRLNISLG